MRLYEIIQEGDKWANAQGSRINWDDQGNAQVPRDVMMKYQALQKDDPEAVIIIPNNIIYLPIFISIFKGNNF